jgi:glycerol-3-phosphate acyltransferase PlsY
MVTGEDIRQMGDGNMGARNVTHVLGWKAGILVAVIDFSKGALVILITKTQGLPTVVQLAAGICTVLGHDFPVFAHFRGGQGMATSLGTMSVLFTEATMIGLLLFALVYLISLHFDTSAGVGLSSLVFSLWKTQQPQIFIGYAVCLFLMIPVKKIWDASHPFAPQALENR